jgi:hypothetical protein
MGKSIIPSIGIALVSLLLTACNLQIVNNDIPKDFFEYSSPENYILGVPNDFAFSEYAPSRNYYYFGYPKGNIRELTTIEIYSNFSSCTPFGLGVSDLKEREVEGTKVWTGLVDGYDVGIMYDYAGHQVPPCVPPDLGFRVTPGDYGDGMERSDASAAYALCSEKDGKRVVVCVQQMMDDPEMAEAIFSTFKWTE